MRKMRANELRQMIKESLGEVQQGKRGMLSEGKTSREYFINSRDIFLRITRPFMEWESLWKKTARAKGIEGEMKNFARIHPDAPPVNISMVSSNLRTLTSLGCSLSAYFPESHGAEVCYELQEEGIIDDSFLRYGATLQWSLSELRGWLAENGVEIPD
jgi:hypothetical protein